VHRLDVSQPLLRGVEGCRIGIQPRKLDTDDMVTKFVVVQRGCSDNLSQLARVSPIGFECGLTMAHAKAAECGRKRP